MIEKNRRITTESVADTLNISVCSAHTFLVEGLGLSKLFARWVPRLLRSDQQQTRADLSMEFFISDHEDHPENIFIFPRLRREATAPGRTSNSTSAAEESVRPAYLNLPPTIRKVVPANYDPLAIPTTPTGEPLLLNFHVKARDIQDIDESSMDITVEWYIRLYWRDSRLRPPPEAAGTEKWTTVHSGIVDHIWVPDTFIDHVKSITSPMLMVKPHSLRMKQDGLCRYSISVTTRLSCTMDFTSYPFDTQDCALSMESYQYRSSEVSYKWLKEGVEVADTIRTVHFAPNFFIVNKGSAIHQNGMDYYYYYYYYYFFFFFFFFSFPRVRVNIRLVRKISYHLINTFLPSGLFVCVSWLTFLIPPDAMPGRMVLTITTLLTLVSMFNSVRGESPRVSYAKAVDLWMMVCIVFVFLVLVEYTVVIRLRERAKNFRIFPAVTKRDPGTSRKTESTVGLNQQYQPKPPKPKGEPKESRPPETSSHYRLLHLDQAMRIKAGSPQSPEDP
ncbi:gamma-aminobutyric acid receptor subunit delta-like [Oratosquilla oratoria]|uniref:gamma-aminobutyric acid receptor subunit delta-like n=1 Tax=Oratosquilla oratoria TaxID=337810 RepID=UPI003F764D2D